MAVCMFPWKMAVDSSHKLSGRLGWLLVTGLGVLDCEVVALQRDYYLREFEKEVGFLQDAKVIMQEVAPVQAERCYELQGNVERLVARVTNINKQRDKYVKISF